MVPAKQHIPLIFCHKKPERSFFWKGKQFPVCARCTGIYIGYLTLPLFLFELVRINIGWTAVLIIPTFLDGWSQAIFNRESNNVVRVVTGVLAGIGMMSLAAIIGQFLGIQILKIIH